jgi:hypothetical protein
MIHALDFVMYVVSVIVLWKLLAWFSGRQWTEELGSLIGAFIVILFTIVYIIVFGFCGVDWVSVKWHEFLPTITW